MSANLLIVVAVIYAIAAGFAIWEGNDVRACLLASFAVGNACLTRMS